MNYSEIINLINTNLASNSKIKAVKHREVEIALLDFIQENLSQSGDIKAIKCDIDYLNANFEVNGLGKNLRSGWAICNGNNGTDNLAGRVIVGYGTGYSELSGIGGEATHTLSKEEMPAHNHSFSASAAGESGGGAPTTGDANEPAGSFGMTNTGGGLAHNNMQPYRVQLYIQKL